MKYILFYPKEIDDEEPKDTVLWKCIFRIHKDIKLPEEMQKMVDEKDHPPLPLYKWEEAFDNLDLLYDFTYAKEYVYLVDNIPAFTVSLLALDINRENNQIVVKEKLAEKILNQMSLKQIMSLNLMYLETIMNKKQVCLERLCNSFFVSDAI
jgi:hypothetical protein